MTRFFSTSARIRAMQQLTLTIIVCLTLVWLAGCRIPARSDIEISGQCEPCETMLQRIEYPDLMFEDYSDGSDLMTPPPVTLSDYHELEPLDLTIDQCVEIALANSKVLQKLNGFVLQSPTASTTLFEPALDETNPFSVEQALSAFDAQFSSTFEYRRNEGTQILPDFLGGGNINTLTDTAFWRNRLTKRTATGATLGYTWNMDYRKSISAFNSNLPDYNIVNGFEFRQPLWKGRGATVNRIAGPDRIEGNYTGVLAARVRGDIGLADFETRVRNLIRDVVFTYWELYFSYRDLDTKLTARDVTRETWENRKLRLDNGVGRPDDEAQARQVYLNFKTQAQNAFVGLTNGQRGLLGAEREMRRLLGLPVNDGRIIRPVTEPTIAPVIFDWDDSQTQTLARRVELRRQKWTIRQRELELIAAKHLNQWNLDAVGTYGFRGFGTNYGASNGAVSSLFEGNLDDWSVGLEMNGAIGNRRGHLAVRNAELQLMREKTILREQQRQALHDLGRAFTEVDRAIENVRVGLNSLVAVEEEMEPKRQRVLEGQDQVFFLLDAQQRFASAESAVHRAIADYNRSLMEYDYATGTLLSRYGIVITEGPWTDEARIKARENACRFEYGGPAPCVDNFPLSAGTYMQDAPGPIARRGWRQGFDTAPDEFSGDLLNQSDVGMDDQESVLNEEFEFLEEE
ncbi:MAG: TolC family protein [Planctomycetota bacterium]